ncbi:chymotrypsin inhibitor [Ixodes scapularis]|uniref:Secreted protein, putative n=1 Tax=Ixodes scapularis TaxID=6945 RepID=B7QA05_IXOSC|nr:chymotrypsin inhibitor [Ixodes scapularis]EEC15677.1 secreted protein, putative [Ixodes scapularis]|eukprot:XP_002399667.1 secreted protein, putative [Ixodes scapularis]
MHKFLLATLVAYVALVSSLPDDDAVNLNVPTQPQCAANEEYKICVSRACGETTCDQPIINPSCEHGCQLGCYCKNGFFRNGEEGCVTKDECPEGSAARTLDLDVNSNE